VSAWILDATYCFVVSRGWKQGWMRVCRGDNNICLLRDPHPTDWWSAREAIRDPWFGFVFVFTCFTPTFSSLHFSPLEPSALPLLACVPCHCFHIHHIIITLLIWELFHRWHKSNSSIKIYVAARVSPFCE